MCSILSCFLDLCSFVIFYGDTDEEKDYIVCEERAVLAMSHKKVLVHSSIVSVRETEVECSKAVDTLML